MTSHPFVVHVTPVRRRGQDQRVTCEGPIEGLAVTGSRVPAGALVRVEAMLHPLGSALEAVGKVRAPWVGECRRCLVTVTGEVEATVDHEIFEEQPSEESYLLEDDRIDLEPLARDAVLLELPQAPLCREDCQGLCPQCGADRNTAPCECAPPRDPRWAALDQLRPESPGAS